LFPPLCPLAPSCFPVLYVFFNGAVIEFGAPGDFFEGSITLIEQKTITCKQTLGVHVVSFNLVLEW
jgi:hypothetical protein